MPLLPTSLGSLHVTEEGLAPGAPALLLWHCLFFDSTIWDALAAALRADYRIVRVDGPGHGQSPAPRAPFTMEECGKAALEVLDALGIGEATLGGLSWGGMVVLRAALAAPGRATALLLLGTTGQAASRRERLRAGALAWCVERWGFPAFAMRGIAAASYARDPRRAHPELRGDLARRLGRLERKPAALAARAVLRDRSGVLDQLTGLRVPALVATGSLDSTFPPAHSQALAAALGTRAVIFEGLGHLSLLEAPDRVVGEVRRFLGAEKAQQAGA